MIPSGKIRKSSRPHSASRNAAFVSLVCLTAAFGIGAANGQITYIDAAEGATGNTFATGATSSDTSWVDFTGPSGDNNTQWSKRSNFANGSTIFQGRGSGIPELTTRIIGLTAGAEYDVWVFFWDTTNTGQQWNIAAGLTSGSLTTYSFDGQGNTTAPVSATTLDFTATVLKTEGDRTMYGVNLGPVTASGTTINVFVDHLTGPGASGGDRTWYDGVGYEIVTPAQDTDGDGLPDSYEQRIIDADPSDTVDGFEDIMGTGAAPAVTDFDNDGSNDAEEYANGTDPLDPDSDDDGLLDGVESNTGTFVDASDTGTDPLDDDSDGDGVKDGVEVANGTDPLDASDPPPPDTPTPTQIAPDGAWTWFNDERAIWHLGKLYSGYVMKNGKVGITRFDPATKTSAHTSLSGFTQVDDHNNPSVTVLPDNRLMVVYSQHNGSSYRRISTVAEPASISDWGNEIATGAGRISYANTYRLTGESDRIFHFNRSINWNPTVHVSDDDGMTFGSPTHFISTGTGGTRPYPKYVSNGVDRIDLIYTDGHPRNDNNSIYHLYYQSGNFHLSDGTALKSLANLPINHDGGERGTKAYSYSSASWGPDDGPDDWIPSGRGWTWDIAYGENDAPVCAFQVQRDNVTGSGWNHDRIYYYYARWTGTEWQRRFIAHGGRGLYDHEDDYGGGMAIDPDDPRVVYISTNAANPFDLTDLDSVPLATNEHYEIWRGVTADGGLTFSWEPVTANSIIDNMRPIVPENHGYDRHVVWFRGTYSTYRSFDTEVVGIFENDERVPENREFGIDFNRNDAYGSPSQSLFRVVSGSTQQQDNAHSYFKNFGSRQVAISQPGAAHLEFRGANDDSSRAIPGGDTSLSFLVSDFIATREGAIDISITNFPAGDYFFRSYHLDTFTGSGLGFAQGATTTAPNTIEARIAGVAQASVRPTSLGADGLNTTFIDDTQIPTLGFNFTHDGSSPLVIEMRSINSNGTDNFLLLNGFEIFRKNP